ncbi:FtsB family cell division protein [Neobacillus cucumis]|uniref:FtsB family cell division protein n=1 Tax=Neobacillus cucumis TaxID=1740721 RepID=UPI0028534EAD|nr:septum formation initiator family protein [Neobacillus cucumis]MDR4950301.1 septum formation initiator family protein [Neobacillus cucumis]MED4224063.1 septum formation initiator family protein [Neobacillus cucumis]
MSTELNRNVSKMQTTYVEQQEYAEIASARKRKLVLRRLSVFFVFASLLTYLMISSYISQTTKLESTLEQKQKLNRQLADIKKQQTILKEDIVKLNDDDYIAKLARKEYFFSKKGEIIFNIPDESKEN